MKPQILLFTAISAISSMAIAGQQADKFQGLDANDDGYISKQEASDNQALSNKWGRLDANNDDQLDQSEFSAFELSDPMNPGMKDHMTDTE